ncbi:GFA family protein [Pelagibacterium xiamenense]|uniref:GFA family protein n=1 Tax=Pelagibacterium xiamenense TaxID=2901140 RepID=UPI001E520EF3|nr:GFA family protein [Pelagibacterium xiamenense]MCD7060841.1 GFA family protein [Pelagibacterium xiamenense]
MKVEGSCHCGAVTFQAEIDPERVRICHCSDCQTLSGTAFRVVAPTPEADFHLISGEPTLYVKTAESGARRIQAFCGACGTPLYATAAEGEARTFGIRVGALKQRGELHPKRQFWHRSRLPWLPDMPGKVISRQ